MTEYNTVERALTIQAPPSSVLPLLTDFRRWQEWSPWERLDPKLQRTYSGPERGVGAVYEWSGNRKAGAGKMAISSIRNNAVIVDVSFVRPFKSVSRCIFTFAGTGAGTHVVWRMRTPRNRFSRLIDIFYDGEKRMGPDLAAGLAELAMVATGRQSDDGRFRDQAAT